MSADDHCFVEWKEQFVSKERGNRIVHYFLKDSSGDSVLAVIGTERSVRHMFYVVSEEFLNAYGAENSVHAGFRWRSRREVVNWLTSMLSKQHRQSDYSSMFVPNIFPFFYYFYFSLFLAFPPLLILDAQCIVCCLHLIVILFTILV